MFDFLKKKKKVEVIAPFPGAVMPISEVPDPVFSQKMVGDGFAVRPEGTVVECRAPVDGELSMIFPTGHAFGIKMENGFEVLVHLGLDTVELDGKGFEVLLKQGDTVKQGDIVIKMDTELIKAAGKDTITPVVFTNKDLVKNLTLDCSKGAKAACEVELN
ncbi:MAG: PTS glucose transporter subunit IIA [Eubacteriales bacterium]|nr:PTS glucose transporter subunit IIA [Eubacteriales bacterium]